jgi:hypothetical protein
LFFQGFVAGVKASIHRIGTRYQDALIWCSITDWLLGMSSRPDVNRLQCWLQSRKAILPQTGDQTAYAAGDTADNRTRPGADTPEYGTNSGTNSGTCCRARRDTRRNTSRFRPGGGGDFFFDDPADNTAGNTGTCGNHNGLPQRHLPYGLGGGDSDLVAAHFAARQDGLGGFNDK